MKKTVVPVVLATLLAGEAWAQASMSLVITALPERSTSHNVPYVRVVLTNDSPRTVTITTGHEGWKDFRFFVQRFDGLTMAKTLLGQVVTGDPHNRVIDRILPPVRIYVQFHPVVLAPGQSFVENADLPPFYDLPPGSYNLRAETTSLQTRNHHVVSSNVIRFAVQ